MPEASVVRLPVAKHYEQLRATDTANVAFRPPRIPPNELFPGKAAELCIDGQPYRIANLSTTGIAFWLPAATATPLADPRQEAVFTLRFGTVTLFAGSGRIVRFEMQGTKMLAALTVQDECLDLHALRIKARQVALVEHGEASTAIVPQDYKAFCMDVLYVLRSFKALAEEFVRGVEAHEQPREAAFLAECEALFLGRWAELSQRGSTLVAPYLAHKTIFQAIKRYTEMTLTPEFLSAPGWRRSFEKPLGYPGDFHVMEFIYSQGRYGTTVFDRLLHSIGVAHGAFVRNRARFVTQCLHALGDKPLGAVKRVTNIGSGPAREIEAYLLEKSDKTPVHFTLVDVEEKALQSACATLYPLLPRQPGRVSVEARCASFMDILRDKLPHDAPQDMIYSLGILDYLSDPRARQFVRAMYDRLAPGGLLVTANVSDTEVKPLWLFSCLMDWTMEYRSAKRMHELTLGLGAASVQVELDASRQVYILTIRKPER